MESLGNRMIVEDGALQRRVIGVLPSSQLEEFLPYVIISLSFM
jgi:hypothetical protein